MGKGCLTSYPFLKRYSILSQADTSSCFICRTAKSNPTPIRPNSDWPMPSPMLMFMPKLIREEAIKPQKPNFLHCHSIIAKMTFSIPTKPSIIIMPGEILAPGKASVMAEPLKKYINATREFATIIKISQAVTQPCRALGRSSCGGVSIISSIFFGLLFQKSTKHPWTIQIFKAQDPSASSTQSQASRICLSLRFVWPVTSLKAYLPESLVWVKYIFPELFIRSNMVRFSSVSLSSSSI